MRAIWSNGLVDEAITPKLYQAVGRLTIQFNALDVFVKQEVLHILSTPEVSLGKIATMKDGFKGRAVLLGKLLQELIVIYPSLQASSQQLRETLKKVEALSDERNKYAHALAVANIYLNANTGQISFLPGLTNRNEDVSTDDVAVERLADRCQKISEEWIGFCGKFNAELKAARTQASNSANSQT